MTEPTHAPAPSSPLDDRLCFMIYSTGFAFNRIYRKPLEQLGLTYPQYLAMVVLWADDGLSVGQICERMRLDSGTLTPLLKRLEALGLVTRARSTDDERRVVVTLTDKGRLLRRRADDVLKIIPEAVGMSAKEVSSLMRRIQGLRDNLDEAAVAPTRVES